MQAQLRRLARRVLTSLHIIDETYNRAKPVDVLLNQGLLGADRPEWMKIDSATVEAQRITRHYAGSLPIPALVAATLRSGSLAMRDPLSFRLSGGRFDYAELCAIVRAYGSPTSREGARLLLDSMTFSNLEYFQKELAGKNGTVIDKDLAEYLLLYLSENPRVDTLIESEQILFVSKLIAAGLVESARKIVAGWNSPTVAQRQVRTDVISPFHQTATSNAAGENEPLLNDDEALWLVAFNSVYSRYGLEPVTLADSDVPPFDRIRAVASATVETGPLVTVIMSCFRPGPELWAGVDSTLAQSWRNLELIVIDDGSGPEYDALLDEIEASDDRVRVLRPTENRGTYACRNEAIDAARGEYITMQDSDDWMHPRRIELHVRHILANPQLVANVSSCFRVSEELFFSQEHGFKLKLCEPSLFFHKERALATAGYFDPVRKAADGEYRRRLELATGTPVERLINIPALTLQRTLSTSLSTSDFGEMWMHESRLAYRSAYTQWHREAARNTADLRIARDATERAFPAPSRISGAPVDPTPIDTLLLGDAVIRMKPGAVDVSAIVARAKALAAEGKVVGFCQVWTAIDVVDHSLRLVPELQKLINDGTVRHVLLDEKRTVGTVVVPDAVTLQYPPSLPVALTVGAVEVSRTGSGPFSRSAVVAASDALFGVAPTWV